MKNKNKKKMLLTENNYLICVSLQDKLFGTLPFRKREVRVREWVRKKEEEKCKKSWIRQL